MVNNGGGEAADYQFSGPHNGIYLCILVCWTRDSNLRAVCRASVSMGMQIGHFALHQSLRRGPRHQHSAERHQRRSQETWAMPTLSRNWPLWAAR